MRPGDDIPPATFSTSRGGLSGLSGGGPDKPDADGQDTSLFPRLVLGWIEADFRVQIRILQHFSKSTRKSPSREQILEISAKKLENFAKISTFFLQILQNFAIFSEIREIFAKFCRIYCRILQKCVDFEKC